MLNKIKLAALDILAKLLEKALMAVEKEIEKMITKGEGK